MPDFYLVVLSFLTGLYDITQEGRWRWVDCVDDEDRFINWAPGSPSEGVDMAMDCGFMLEDGTWQDWDCLEHLPYVCEITQKGEKDWMTLHRPLHSA